MELTAELRAEFIRQISYDMNLHQLTEVTDIELFNNTLFFTIRYNRFTEIKYQGLIVKVMDWYYWITEYKILDCN